MENYIKVLKKVKEYTENHISDLPFHNYKHTKTVVEATREIGESENLTEKELALLEISAWFHDTGYKTTESKDHEEVSAQLATDFLKDQLPAEEIQTIRQCIIATKIPQTPRNILEQILCDADLSHLGGDDFYEFSESLRKEIAENTFGKKLSKSRWILMNINFLSEHRYFTNYAREHFNPEKQAHIKQLQSQANELMKKNKTKKKARKEMPRRDLESLFRILAKNQLGLSSIADRKASILLSINSIITSLAVGFLFSYIETVPQLTIPTLILVSTGLISVILAVIATRPNYSKGKKLSKDPKNINIMFFESFVNLSLEDYQSTLKESTKTPGDIYDLLSRDSYYLGKVLSVKYKRVRFAFNFFMIGLTVSVIAFVISFIVS